MIVCNQGGWTSHIQRCGKTDASLRYNESVAKPCTIRNVGATYVNQPHKNNFDCMPVFVLWCSVMCFGYTRIRSLFNRMESGSSGQAPLRSLRLTIDKSQREELFGQLRKFADKHGFEYQITDFNTDGENFQFLDVARRHKNNRW